MILFALVLTPCANAATKGGNCELPKELSKQIATVYPGSRVVTVADLEEYDASLFKREHHDDCPGMVKVDFYGNGAPTLALALRGTTGGQNQTKLVLATKVIRWKLRLLDTMDGFAAVVWSENPGEYTDVYGKKELRAKYPPVVFCKYEALALLYAWTGKRVSKIWIAD